jgi:hypothetical protein
MRRRLSRRAEGTRRRFVAYGDGKLGPRLSHPGNLTQSVRFAVNQLEPAVVLGPRLAWSRLFRRQSLARREESISIKARPNARQHPTLRIQSAIS